MILASVSLHGQAPLVFRVQWCVNPMVSVERAPDSPCRRQATGGTRQCAPCHGSQHLLPIPAKKRYEVSYRLALAIAQERQIRVSLLSDMDLLNTDMVK